MTTKTRLEKLERALPADGSCPTCGQVKPDPVAQAAAMAALRADAEALLARILPHYDGDRAAAIAAIRENAPSLSEYVN